MSEVTLYTTRLGELLDGSPGNSVVAYLDHTIALGIGGDHVGLIKSTKAPKGCMDFDVNAEARIWP